MFELKHVTILRILLKNNDWMYGSDIISQSDGTLTNGNIYVHLNILAESGYISTRQETDEEFAKHAHAGLRRSLYKITKKGSNHLEDLQVREFEI